MITHGTVVVTGSLMLVIPELREREMRSNPWYHL